MYADLHTVADAVFQRGGDSHESSGISKPPGNREAFSTPDKSSARPSGASEPNSPGSMSCHAHALDGDSENGPGAGPTPRSVSASQRQQSCRRYNGGAGMLMSTSGTAQVKLGEQPGERIPAPQDGLVPPVEVLQDVHSGVEQGS